MDERMHSDPVWSSALYMTNWPPQTSHHKGTQQATYVLLCGIKENISSMWLHLTQFQDEVTQDVNWTDPLRFQPPRVTTELVTCSERRLGQRGQRMMNSLAEGERGRKCILIWPRCSVRDQIYTVQHIQSGWCIRLWCERQTAIAREMVWDITTDGLI